VITDDLAALVREAVFAARDSGEFTLSDEEIQVVLNTPKPNSMATMPAISR